VYKYARSLFASDSIIIYGKSMGTGIAAYLASRVECKQLVLETPYYDMPSVVKHYLPMYPVEKLLHYRLPTYLYLPLVEAPVTIFHGTSDGVIRYENASRLRRFLKPSDKFVTIDGGKHNNLHDFPEMLEKLDSLLLR
jgi:uncharacterized protein